MSALRVIPIHAIRDTSAGQIRSRCIETDHEKFIGSVAVLTESWPSGFLPPFGRFVGAHELSAELLVREHYAVW